MQRGEGNEPAARRGVGGQQVEHDELSVDDEKREAHEERAAPRAEGRGERVPVQIQVLQFQGVLILQEEEKIQTPLAWWACILAGCGGVRWVRRCFEEGDKRNQ